MRVHHFARLILQEHERACEKFKPFNNPHEGYAVILEELDELWDAIKRNNPTGLLAEEAIQVGAMALRFLTDCCDASTGNDPESD